MLSQTKIFNRFGKRTIQTKTSGNVSKCFKFIGCAVGVIVACIGYNEYYYRKMLPDRSFAVGELYFPTQQDYDRVLEKNINYFNVMSDNYKTQEICNKAVAHDHNMFRKVPEKFRTEELQKRFDEKSNFGEGSVVRE